MQLVPFHLDLLMHGSGTHSELTGVVVRSVLAPARSLVVMHLLRPCSPSRPMQEASGMHRDLRPSMTSVSTGELLVSRQTYVQGNKTDPPLAHDTTRWCHSDGRSTYAGRVALSGGAWLA